MGSFDGADISELVCLFLLNNLTQLVRSNNIGLYRDNGLAILKNPTGPSLERINKRIIKLFKHHGLKIAAEINFIQINFLNVTLNLKLGRYWLFRKPTTNLFIYIDYLTIRQLSTSNCHKCLLLASRSSRATARNFPKQPGVHEGYASKRTH